MWQEVTFASASADLDNFVEIDTGPGDAGQNDGSAQALRVFAQSDHVSDENVLTFALVRANEVYAIATATLTPTARRTAADNSSGSYVCGVVFDESSNSKLDLLGDWYQTRQKNRGASGTRAGAVWMVGLTTKGASTTSVTVQMASSSSA